jgi:hypothetical protein
MLYDEFGNLTPGGDSAVKAITRDRLLREVAEHKRKPMSDEEIQAECQLAEDRNVYGHNAKKDANGRWIQQGIGSRGRETGNHLAAIKKYEGPAAYQKELRRIWKDSPDHAREQGFPEPERLATS